MVFDSLAIGTIERTSNIARVQGCETVGKLQPAKFDLERGSLSV